MSISGTVDDTVAKTPLRYAVVTAVRIRDSVLLAYTRTDALGHFGFKNMPVDTVQVTISSPRFNEQTYYVFGSSTNNAFDFGKIVLPPKSQQLSEVVIYAFKDPVYYKGDTLVYTADSFKVKPNATVEDLIRKLPGMSVDAQGKITSQGKAVDQVLVDGDEFFGSDPTVATKNLSASGVESVQVYEKKNDNSSDDSKETLQVMNLKMKDDAKKGYFGKASGATDAQNFYEGEFLANKFKGKQKISVFALASNTPKAAFNWGDVYKYGLDNDYNTSTDDNGTTFWYSNNNQPQGIPRTLKTGFYYVDKVAKNTKINVNYTYSNNQLKTNSSTHSQYFLNDTSYVTDNTSMSDQLTESHALNFGIVQNIDSLTDLEITPKLQYATNNTTTSTTNKYLTAMDTLSRRTDVNNTNKAMGYNLNTVARLTRRFKKKDRLLVLTYNNVLKNDNARGILHSSNTFYSDLSSPYDSLNINQQKESASNIANHSARLTYTEPLTKKIKLEFEYTFSYNVSRQDKTAMNFANGSYSVEDPDYTNNFKNTQMLNKAGLKFIYETKKIRLALGGRAQAREMESHNLIMNQVFKQKGNSILPYATYTYRFSDTRRFNFSYYTAATQPSIYQLQPVPDNTNPNLIVIGNANLKQSYLHRFEATYNTYKPLTGRYIWASLNYNLTSNGFSNSTYYDSIGRAVSQTVNVNGNYSASAYISGGIPLFSKKLKLNPSLNADASKSVNYINSEKNTNLQKGAGAGLGIDVETDTLMLSVGANYSYNSSTSSLNPSSTRPYSSQQYNASITLKLPYKLSLESDATYTVNSQRTQGYNINYVLWNASLNKAFLRNENLVVSFICNDILDQNISTSRTIQDNVITDTKISIISRYFMLKVLFKFNSTKTKDDDDFGM